MLALIDLSFLLVPLSDQIGMSVGCVILCALWAGRNSHRTSDSSSEDEGLTESAKPSYMKTRSVTNSAQSNGKTSFTTVTKRVKN